MKNFYGEGSQARPWDPPWGEIFFNSSERVFQVKKSRWFFVTRGGGWGGQRRFDICHKKSGFFFLKASLTLSLSKLQIRKAYPRDQSYCPLTLINLNRTEERILMMISCVWVLSILISIPPLLYPPWSIPYPFDTLTQVCISLMVIFGSEKKP